MRSTSPEESPTIFEQDEELCANLNGTLKHEIYRLPARPFVKSSDRPDSGTGSQDRIQRIARWEAGSNGSFGWLVRRAT